MKLATNHSHFATQFTRYLDASRDMDILARLSGESDRVFPTFHPIGTVSSRILIADPYIQELRRKYREVICSENDMELAYFDYSQFEPGIMAALAGDADLMSLYNQGDVYKALSIAVYGVPEHRQICKRVFLAYSYGMSLKGIAVLLCGKNASDADREFMENKIRQFFERYKSLVLFKSGLEDVLLRDGSVKTLEGNRRQRLQGGKLSSKERRWAVSQVVQGTASLIFKHALINIMRKFGKNALLIPVHDAILMQLPTEEIYAHRAAVVEIMQKSFSRFCPGVSVRVTSGSFHE
ncbi:DNA polymerase [Methylobacterium sp. 88A]|uniref:DNA polymerase n=1 Tax=Methylobacterium sp. 88A TaxID=1131813 RepID=UPI0009DAED14|nr:DNA polymerase [Methylobacterium sp. 88A]